MTSLRHVRIASIATLCVLGHYHVKEGLLEYKHSDALTVNLITKTATKGLRNGLHWTKR